MAATATRPAPAAGPPTAEERRQRGREARARTPRSSHADWSPAEGRADPVELLHADDATRVPELVPIRYGRMLVSPFTFYRGAAALMAADLAATPRSGIEAQLCGDAHLSNFGVYSAPDRRLVFDLNDFDETLPGPWEWDVKRLAASLEVAGRDRGFKRRERRDVVVTTVAEYRQAMRAFSVMRNLDVWYARVDVDRFLEEMSSTARASDVRAARRNLEKARAKDSVRALAKLTERVNGSVRIVNAPPLIVPIEDMLPDDTARDVREEMRGLLRSYQRTLRPEVRRLASTYRYVDMAHKVVGVGSVGNRAWMVLLEGRDESDPLVLQAKEAGPSALESHLKASRYRNHGERVVQGQRLMQAASDMFLGWQRVHGLDGRERDFYIRQLWDGKGSVVVENMDPVRLTMYGRLCGWTLARAHARSGDRVAIAGYLGSGPVFENAIADFSETYADQNEVDYAALRKAVADGRITAQEGV
jgi:uncharacterized protein (DUF2252 family)